MSQPATGGGLDSGAAADAAATVQAIKENAQRLGLTWSMRTATVTDSDPVAAQYDGDPQAIGMTSMIGSLQTGQRVYVLEVPPSGNYICGAFDLIAPGMLDGWAAATGSGAFISAETAVLATGIVMFKAACAYEIDFEIDVENDTAGSFANIQIRKTSVAGAVLRANSGHPMASLAGYGSTCKGSAIVRNISTADITFAAVLTLSSPLAGSVRISGAANRLAYLRVTYIGPASSFPFATTL